jgi:hypothetical protein
VKDPGSEGQNMGRYSSDSELYWDSGDSAFRAMKKAREKIFLVFAVVSKIASNRDRLEGSDRMTVQACGPEEICAMHLGVFSFFLSSSFRDSTEIQQIDRPESGSRDHINDDHTSISTPFGTH